MARATCFSEGSDLPAKICFKKLIIHLFYNKSYSPGELCNIMSSRDRECRRKSGRGPHVSNGILQSPGAKGAIMEERDFFSEKDELVAAQIYCAKCRTTQDYQIKWRRRVKKGALPPGADERDRARFAKLRNYRVRLDDKIRCKNTRCGKTIEITSLQTVVFD